MFDKNERFEKIYSQGAMTVSEIWVDKETGVNYLYHASGYSGGHVRIHHCENEKAAHTLRNMIKDIYPTAKVDVDTTKGLCSFYAERGGLLVGFEGDSKYSSNK